MLYFFRRKIIRRKLTAFDLSLTILELLEVEEIGKVTLNNLLFLTYALGLVNGQNIILGTFHATPNAILHKSFLKLYYKYKISKEFLISLGATERANKKENEFVLSTLKRYGNLSNQRLGDMIRSGALWQKTRNRATKQTPRPAILEKDIIEFNEG